MCKLTCLGCYGAASGGDDDGTHGCQDKEGERDPCAQCAQSVCRNVHELVRSAIALGMDKVAEVEAMCKVR